MSDWLTTKILTGVGSLIDGWAWLSGEASATVINSAVEVTWRRPHPFSCSASIRMSGARQLG